MMDDDTAAQVHELTAKGCTGTIFLETDDCRASYGAMTARGVAFVDLHEERPHGIDSSLRDPSGNHIRLTQVMTALSLNPSQIVDAGDESAV